MRIFKRNNMIETKIGKISRDTFRNRPEMIEERYNTIIEKKEKGLNKLFDAFEDALNYAAKQLSIDEDSKNSEQSYMHNITYLTKRGEKAKKKFLTQLKKALKHNKKYLKNEELTREIEELKDERDGYFSKAIFHKDWWCKMKLFKWFKGLFKRKNKEQINYATGETIVAYMKIRKEVKEGLEIEGVDFDVDELALELFNHESNYQNADVTSGMTCYTEGEITTAIEEVLKALKGDSNRCSDCGCLLKDEDYKTIYEDRGEFWGQSSVEEITTGYTCSSCRHKEGC